MKIRNIATILMLIPSAVFAQGSIFENNTTEDALIEYYDTRQRRDLSPSSRDDDSFYRRQDMDTLKQKLNQSKANRILQRQQDDFNTSRRERELEND